MTEHKYKLTGDLFMPDEMASNEQQCAFLAGISMMGFAVSKRVRELSEERGDTCSEEFHQAFKEEVQELLQQLKVMARPVGVVVT